MLSLVENKKGLLLKTTIGIFVALLCISGLVYLSVQIYSITNRNQELRQASAVLEEIKERIDDLEEGGIVEYLVMGPKDWRIISYENDLCICPQVDNKDEQKDLCFSEGVCEGNGGNKNISLEGLGMSCSGTNYNLGGCLELNTVPREIILFNYSGRILIRTKGIIGEEKKSIPWSSERDGEKHSGNFSVVSHQIGNQNFLFINFYPIIVTQEYARQNSPEIFLYKVYGDWIRLGVNYQQGRLNYQTAGNKFWVGGNKEMGYISLKDGSVWVSEDFIKSYFSLNPTFLEKLIPEEKYKASYKLSLKLDLEVLKEIIFSENYNY
jgi:hypothetical protein